MRLYESATIQEELLTGFQSPCSEFAAKPISFDERYGVGDPGLKLITVENDFPHLGIFKNDQLLVDLSKRPGPKGLIVTIIDDEVRLFHANQFKNVDDLVCGMVKVIIRHIYD
jgi:hypothetical protein